MTSIVVSKRDGVAREPNGTQHRVARGKTLADARHPLVLAYPGDWAPMVVELSVDDAPGTAAANSDDLLDRLGQAENDLAEVEELAEHRGVELQRLADALDARGLVPDPRPARNGWLVDLVLDLLPPLLEGTAPAELPVDAPAPHSAVAEITPPRQPRKPRTPRA